MFLMFLAVNLWTDKMRCMRIHAAPSDFLSMSSHGNPGAMDSADWQAETSIGIEQLWTV